MGYLEQVRDIGNACVPVVSQAEMARHLRASGKRVVEHRGRYWCQLVPGFYRTVHALARLSAEEATRPTVACWGFQTCLTEHDAHLANAEVPMHVISDLDRFDEDLLPKSRRRTLRQARERAWLVELTGPALLRDQGYDVLLSAQSRTRYGKLPTKEDYLAALERFGEPAEGIVLAGIVDGRLAGYTNGYAVDGTAYSRNMVIATWALRTNISTGLHYEFIHACRRAQSIREIVDGLHAREDEGLCRHKELLGVPLLRIPARLTMLPGAAALIRRRAPHKYYRLSGRG